MNTSATSDGTENTPKSRSSFYFGFLPILLLFVLIIGFRVIPHSVVIYEPHYLLPAFNTILCLAAGVIAYIALWSYLLSGAAAILWLGCGVLALGLGALAAGWLIYPFGPNVNVTIFNVGALLAAVCHAGAVLTSLEEQSGEVDPGRRRRLARRAYLVVSAAIVLVVVLTLTGIMPPFFIQGKGPTILRQYVVEWAIVLYIFAALVIMNRFLRKREPFHYWYSLALVLVALAMLAFYLQPAVGSPVGWLGRSSYVVAAIYFLIAVSSAWRAARTWGVGLDETLSRLFGRGPHWQEILATVSDAVVSCDHQGKILLWNKAAENIFGYPEAEAVGQGLTLILPDTKFIARLADGFKEIELTRRDSSRFSAEISTSTRDSALGVITSLVIRDVTLRKKAEEALRESEQHYRSLFDHMLEGFAYCQMHFEQDQPVDFTYLNVNEAFEALTGLKNVTGKKVSEIIPGLREADPDLLEIYGRVAATGLPERFEWYVKSLQMWFAISVYSPRQGYFVAVFDVITERKRAEDALRESEERFRTMANAIPQLAWTARSDGYIFWYNQRWYDYTGTRPEDMEGWGWQSVHDPKVLPEVMEQWRTSIATGVPFEMVFPLRGRDGHFRQFLTRVVPIKDADGRVSQWFGTNTDVTERKLAEEALRASEARFRALFEGAAVGIALTDLVGRILGSNAAFQELTGYSQDELLSKKFADITHPDDLSRNLELVYDVWNGTRDRFRLEKRYIRKDGKIIWVDLSAALVRDAHGKPHFLVTMAEDITGRKLAEEALRRLNEELEQRVEVRTAALQNTVAQLEEEVTDRQQAEAGLKAERQRFYEVLERIPAHVSLLRPDHTFAFFNGEFERRFGDPGSRRCYELLGRQTPCEECQAMQVFQTGKPVIWQWTSPEGKYYQIYDYPFTDADGSPLALEMGVDLTDRKAAEEEIRRLNEELEQRVKERTAELEFANQELEAFTYSVSHDLKAPLRAIDGFSRMLMTEHTDKLDAEALRLLRVVSANTLLMAHLIDDLLALSRLGRQQLRKSAVNLTSMANQVFNQLREEAPERDLRFTVGDLPPAWGDQSLLYQVMMNLLTNAIKFTRSRQTAAIEVGGWSGENENIYYVKDNGAGFDDRYSGNLFRPFQRLHGGEAYEGSGVGLAIVKRIVERHGGRAWAEGKVNEGAAFYFALPKTGG